MFKKQLLVLVTLALCVASACQNASASWVVPGTIIKLWDGYGNVNAGEFKVTDATVMSNPTPAQVRFNTFCVQVNEYVNLGEQLRVGAISNFDDSSSPRALSARTSALYREFLRGSTKFFGYTSASYNYGNNSTHESDAGKLQQAIWKFQGQSGYASVDNKYTRAVEAFALSKGWAAGMAATSIAAADQALYGGVKILNLFRGNGFTQKAQDQLYFDQSSPIGGSPVPEPATVALYALGAFGMVWVGRRKMRNLPAA